jgi:hypothetical protein
MGKYYTLINEIYARNVNEHKLKQDSRETTHFSFKKLRIKLTIPRFNKFFKIHYKIKKKKLIKFVK